MKSLLKKENNCILYRFLGDPKRDDETVRHRAERAHRIISSPARALFIVSLVIMLIKYPGIPDETGVHFIGLAYMPETNSLHERLMRILHEYQEIDVTAAKWLLFYPQLITLVMLAAGMILPVTAGRVRARMSKSAQLRLIGGLKDSARYGRADLFGVFLRGVDIPYTPAAADEGAFHRSLCGAFTDDLCRAYSLCSHGLEGRKDK